MSEADERAWAEQLKGRYGITEPVAEEPSDAEIIRSFFDTEPQITGRTMTWVL